MTTALAAATRPVERARGRRCRCRARSESCSVPSTSQRTERQIDRPRPLPCGLVVKKGSSTRGRCSAGIPHPVSAIEISMLRSPARAVTTIRPPCGVASRALVSRLRNTCSRSLWLQATAGMLVRHVHLQLDGAPAHAVLQDGGRRLDRAPYLCVADAARRVARKCQHAAKDAPADLERLLHVLEVSANTVGVSSAAAQVRLHLLDQRQHRPKRVIHVVRHAARQIGHGVFALGRHHAGAQRLGAMQVLDGDGRLGSKMLDQLGVERLELFRVARRDLQDADEAVARHQRRTQHRRFANMLAVGGIWLL